MSCNAVWIKSLKTGIHSISQGRSSQCPFLSFIHATMFIEHHSVAVTVLVGGNTEVSKSDKFPPHKAAEMVGRQTRNQ